MTIISDWLFLVPDGTGMFALYDRVHASSGTNLQCIILFFFLGYHDDGASELL